MFFCLSGGENNDRSKTLNNNIVLVQDQMGNEKVLFGTGIGFKRDKGIQSMKV